MKAHFGGAIDAVFGTQVYVGLVALAVNLVVAVVASAVLRLARVPAGVDATRAEDYTADADDPMVKRLDDLLDGLPRTMAGAHTRDARARLPG